MRKLKIASAWFSAFLTTKPFEETKLAFLAHRDFLYEMGAKVIVISEQGRSIQGEQTTPLFAEKPVFTNNEWRQLADGLEALGELALEKGMKLVYHHHMGTGVQTAEEIDRLMEMTEQRLVSLLYDTGHLYFSGENPLDILQRHMSRIKHVHLKDVRPAVAERVQKERLSFLTGVKQGVFTVPGDGVLDFAPIFAALAASDYEGWMIVEAEQDPALANPLEYALIARNYLKQTAGV